MIICSPFIVLLKLLKTVNKEIVVVVVDGTELHIEGIECFIHQIFRNHNRCYTYFLIVVVVDVE